MEKKTNRQNYLYISQEGLKFRNQLRIETQSASPKQYRDNQRSLRTEFSKEHISNCIKVGNSSYYQFISKKKILRNIQKQLKVNRPYENVILDKMTTRVIRAETPITNISNRIIELYSEIDKDYEKFHRVNESIDQIQHEPSFLLLQQKFNRLQDNYQLQLNKHQYTKKYIQEIMQSDKELKQKEEESYEYDFIRPRNKSIQRSFYKDQNYQERRINRIKDYQKLKYEKYWRIQPILNRTVKHP